MHYYTRNIADFNNATRHLNRQERSIYSDLLELQYDLESPIPNDLDWICRKVLAFTDSERTDVERMLNEFFDSVEQGWSNGRCETEIAAFRDKQEKAIAAGPSSISGCERTAYLPSGASRLNWLPAFLDWTLDQTYLSNEGALPGFLGSVYAIRRHPTEQ